VRRYHFSVLVALAEDGAASQAALGRRLWIDRSDMVATGKRTLERLDAKVEEAQAAFLEPLSAAERRELLELLARLVEHHGEHR
jgi:MarR family transcriptional regulator, lower aerobic nicotinate degradation pathway regulator